MITIVHLLSMFPLYNERLNMQMIDCTSVLTAFIIVISNSLIIFEGIITTMRVMSNDESFLGMASMKNIITGGCVELVFAN